MKTCAKIHIFTINFYLLFLIRQALHKLMSPLGSASNEKLFMLTLTFPCPLRPTNQQASSRKSLYTFCWVLSPPQIGKTKGIEVRPPFVFATKCLAEHIKERGNGGLSLLWSWVFIIVLFPIMVLPRRGLFMLFSLLHRSKIIIECFNSSFTKLRRSGIIQPILCSLQFTKANFNALCVVVLQTVNLIILAERKLPRHIFGGPANNVKFKSTSERLNWQGSLSFTKTAPYVRGIYLCFKLPCRTP